MAFDVFFVSVMVVVAVVALPETEVLLETFRVVSGEFIEDLLEGVGEVVVDLRRLLRRCKTTLSGDGSNTKSATRGDSVSLN